MLTRFFNPNRPEPTLDLQPYALEHLRALGRGVPKHLLSDAAYGALLVVAASRVVTVDAYTHGDPRHGGEWVIECHGIYSWQEPRFSPEQWQAFYEVRLEDRYREGTLNGEWWLAVCSRLAESYPNGQLASTADHIVGLNRRIREESRLFGGWKGGVA